MGNRVIHISDAEAALDFKSLLERLAAGDEFVIERDDRPVAVLRRLADPERAQSDGRDRTRLEFEWLAENRERYAGRWVALDGNSLLAVGDSGREVYAAVADHQGTPLVTRVESEEELYFAGW